MVPRTVAVAHIRGGGGVGCGDPEGRLEGRIGASGREAVRNVCGGLMGGVVMTIGGYLGNFGYDDGFVDGGSCVVSGLLVLVGWWRWR